MVNKYKELYDIIGSHQEMKSEPYANHCILD